MPCRREAPYLSRLVEKYGERGFIVVAVNSWDEPASVLRKFAREKKLRQKILLKGSKVAEEIYGAVNSPTTFWIDRKGRVLYREEGFSEARVPHMEHEVERLLAKTH